MAQTTTILSLTATPKPIPAKHTVRSNLILRTLCTIPRTHPLLFCANAISAKPLRANPPQKYIYPDPNPEFAEAETKKFREELVKKLSKEKETYGGELDAVVNVCTDANLIMSLCHGAGNVPHMLLRLPRGSASKVMILDGHARRCRRGQDLDFCR
nr:protein PLASTID REDOX INSENSITIVE 2, chloroplastic-like isoform X3 [Coffea arabica]